MFVARGQSLADLQMHLFEGYAKTAVEDFVRYMQNKRDYHKDGSHPLSIEALTSLAINKCALKVQSNTWSVAGTKDTRIIALEAAIKKLTDGKKQPRVQNATTNATSDIKYAWKLIPPAAGDNYVKSWNKN